MHKKTPLKTSRRKQNNGAHKHNTQATDMVPCGIDLRARHCARGQRTMHYHGLARSANALPTSENSMSPSPSYFLGGKQRVYFAVFAGFRIGLPLIACRPTERGRDLFPSWVSVSFGALLCSCLTRVHQAASGAQQPQVQNGYAFQATVSHACLLGSPGFVDTGTTR